MIGYCCINKTLRKDNIYTNRSLIRRTFTIEKASELSLQNVRDLLAILRWNVDHGIRVFRVSSGIFPRITDDVNGYSIDDLKDSGDIRGCLSKCGDFAVQNGMILTCHPGPFTVLASTTPSVVHNSIREVEMHVALGKMIYANHDARFNINFHVGCGFSEEAGERFCDAFGRLSDDAKSMISIENDDKVNGWSIHKLYKHIHCPLGVPIAFDHHHSEFSRRSDVTIEDEFELARSTWKGKLMEVHYSESAGEDKLMRKHAGFISKLIPEFLFDGTYILVEAKEKELAVLRYCECLI